MSPLRAKRQRIPLRIIPQNAVDRVKVNIYADAMERGEVFPPVVVAKYGDSYMPLDGHHRMYAARLAGLETIDAYVIGGRAFENRDLYGDGRAENHILCDGVLAMDVAQHYKLKPETS